MVLPKNIQPVIVQKQLVHRLSADLLPTRKRKPDYELPLTENLSFDRFIVGVGYFDG